MPMPKMPSAAPRWEGGNQELTRGTPIANVVPPSPRKKPTSSRTGYDAFAGISSGTGMIVSALVSGNIRRAP